VLPAWWDRRWRLVIFIILFPIWFVPVISVLLFPEMPLVRSILYGVVLFLLIAVGFRAARAAKTFGLRFLVVMVIVASLAGLLLGFLSKLF
jgi:hypothetical protein